MTTPALTQKVTILDDSGDSGLILGGFWTELTGIKVYSGPGSPGTPRYSGLESPESTKVTKVTIFTLSQVILTF